MVRSCCLSVVALFLTANLADAKIMLITHGETIAHVGNLVERPDPSIPAGVAVGYKYSYGGLFWLDFWRWGGEYCLFEGENWQPIDEATAAKLLGTTQDKLTKPFWYRFPPVPFVVGVLLALFVPLGIYGLIVDGRRKKLYQELKQDPAYKTALKLATKVDKPATDDEPEANAAPPADETEAEIERFENGVDHLVKSGVDEAVARKNLQLMIEVKAELKKEKQKTTESQA